MELLTAAQMRAAERAAIESGAVTGLELMERAGRGVVEAVLDWRPELATAPHRAVVLCGPGNNGGDGFVVARLLRERGWEVEVFLYGDAAKLPPDAAENHRRWREMGGATHGWDDAAIEERIDGGEDDLVVDALFGTGLTRAMPDDSELTWRGVMGSVHDAGPPRHVAVDIPSGICSDSGANMEGALPANLTVTFHRPKLGHHLSDTRKLAGGARFCGAVRVVDIGLRSDPAEDTVRLLEGARSLSRPAWENKYAHGHALILSGGVGRGGAARLAARGALRVGAGLVTLGAPPAAIIENAAQLNAIMLRPVADAAALEEALEDARLNAVALGMGLGVGERARELAEVALGADRGVVLDADALSSFADEPDDLFEITRGTRTVMVPHMGEFGRIFPDLAQKLSAPAEKGPAYSKVDAAREAAARAGCVVLLKGPDTVIADAEGRAAVNSAQYERAAPWLATAGAGDVLAGMIAGLLARGLPARPAAEMGAWLHVEAARKFGPGLIAEDIPEQLPAVFRDLGL